LNLRAFKGVKMRAIVPVLMLMAVMFSCAVVTGAQGNGATRALTFTIAADKAGKFGNYALGEVDPINLEQCKRTLAAYAAEKDASGSFPGMDATTRQSGNTLALRCDGRAPVSQASALMNLARRAGLVRLALALTQDFPASDFEAVRENPASPLRRAVLVDVGEGYRTPAPCPPRRDDDECLTLLLSWSADTKQAAFALEGGKPEAACRLEEVLVDAKAPQKNRDAALKRRREISAQISNLLEAGRANMKAAQARLVIAPESLRTAGVETPPWIFALLALDGALDFNSRRGKASWLIDFLPAELPQAKAQVALPAAFSKAFEPRRAKGENASRVEAALRWLADHQNAGGHWSSNRFREDSVRKQARVSANLEFIAPHESKGDLGREGSDLGVTGIALMAFAGAGCDIGVGDFHENCRRGLMYLLKVQGSDGCFGLKEESSFVYAHAMATCALAEFYGLSGNALLKEPLERAIAFILLAQNPGMGWRYGVKPGENDTSVTGWMVEALHTAKLAGVEFECVKAFSGAANWFDFVTVDVGGRPKTGYNQPGTDNARNRDAVDYETNPAMDAVHVYCRLAMGDWDANNPKLKAQSNAITACLPEWTHHKLDFYYWFHASNAMFQMGDACWTKWSKPLFETLTANQRGWRKEDEGNNAETLDEYGSWDAVDAWHSAGGRVYSTALCCLMLETPNRFARFSGK
jgi:hypothetical protein